MATNFEINYEDERFKNVENDKNAAIAENNKIYDGMINQSDSYFDAQIQAQKDWEKQQIANQNEKTDFTIEQIEQQKAQAKKDYTREQSGAYTDWQKQSNKYGVNAEGMAANGMQNTGFSESSQVSMYNTYQNRVATARESYNLIIQNYDNAIKDARIQNNSAIAEIAFNSMQKQFELSFQGFQYKNQLIIDKANKKTEIDDRYYGRSQDIVTQINTENAQAEQVRQFNEKMEEEKRQYNEQMAFQKEQFEWTKAQADKSSSSSGGGGGYSSRGRGGGDDSKIDKGESTKSKPTPAKITAPKSKVTNPNETVKSKSDDKAAAASVLALGAGPRSPEWVAKQVNAGRVVETTNKKGQTVFKWSGKMIK